MQQPRTVIRKFRLDELLPHPRAQRDIIPARQKKLVREFDPEAIGVIHCVEYKINDREAPWVIEGMHRWSAGMELGYGELKVNALMHYDVKDDARSCELFLKLNDRAAIAQYFKYRAELAAQYPQAVAIEETVKSFGLEVSNSAGDGKIVAVSSLRSASARDVINLFNALDTITRAWGTKQAALEGKIIQGFGLVFAANNGSVDKASMIHKVSKYPGGPTAMLGAARGLREYNKLTVPRCVASIIIDTYNKGKRTEVLPPI